MVWVKWEGSWCVAVAFSARLGATALPGLLMLFPFWSSYILLDKLHYFFSADAIKQLILHSCYTYLLQSRWPLFYRSGCWEHRSSSTLVALSSCTQGLCPLCPLAQQSQPKPWPVPAWRNSETFLYKSAAEEGASCYEVDQCFLCSLLWKALWLQQTALPVEFVRSQDCLPDVYHCLVFV